MFLNDGRMGDELAGSRNVSRRVLRVRAIGERPIAAIDIIRNGREVRTHRPDTEDAVFEWEDPDDFARISLTGHDGKPFLYYYVRVTQTDGEIAWSSPVWIS
jgi:hypothetical protein